MFTKNYIKQCEQVKEIQKLWKPKVGDWYRDLDGDVECVSLMGELIIKHHAKYHTYLPTQEQLQEMIKNECYEKNNFKSFISDFYYYLLDEYEAIDIIESLNEAWLSFYMQEKYSKIWTGEKWVKAE